MITTQDICNFLVKARGCSSKLACDYVVDVTYGYMGAEAKLDKLNYLRCLIRSVENYELPNGNDFVLDGVIHLRDEQIVASQKNSLYLVSQGKKIPVTPEDINCLSTEELCNVIDMIRVICPSC